MRNKKTLHKTQYWHPLPNGKIQCDVCPRGCKLKNGQQGLCFVRSCEDNEIVLTSYGRSSGFCIDPIEKKPLNHFHPGQPILSFGTAGCNLACQFCQNWDISKSREIDTLASQATPEALALAAKEAGCIGIAFTYNDPVVFMEYAIDCAIACHQHDLKAVAVTAGYICPTPRKELFSYMDAVNVDLKAFSDRFYNKIVGGKLSSVLETLLHIQYESNAWLEITTLLIPGENDSSKEIAAMSRWIAENLGPDVPLHFSGFHPDWKMRDHPPTPLTTLQRARKIALEHGLHYVYTGNVHDKTGDATRCSECGVLLIERDWYQIIGYHLTAEGKCPHCEHPCPGVYDSTPGNWGHKRIPIQIVN
tara:strand:+ start:8705 stop:9787 length:1083 start_codon:yes stop_codon:yes gene_type:complete